MHTTVHSQTAFPIKTNITPSPVLYFLSLQYFMYHTFLPGVLLYPSPSLDYHQHCCHEQCLSPEQDTVTVRFRSCVFCWGCALCVHREGRSLSDGLHPKLSSTESSPLLVMCGAMGLSCGKSCPTERGLTGTWLIKMYVFNFCWNNF